MTSSLSRVRFAFTCEHVDRDSTGPIWANNGHALTICSFRNLLGRLNREINAALADPKIGARITDLGGMVLAGSPAEFGKLLADETEKWGNVIRVANIKPV